MLYGSGFFGVTEANYSVVAVHYFSWLFGAPTWQSHPLARLAGPRAQLAAVLPAWVSGFLAGLQLFDLMGALIVFLAWMNCYPQLQRVFRLSGTKQVGACIS